MDPSAPTRATGRPGGVAGSGTELRTSARQPGGPVARLATPGLNGVGGVVAAAGALGGFFPPLVMGATYNQAENNYFIGLMLLAVTAFLAFLSAFLVPHGGKPDHAKHAK